MHPALARTLKYQQSIVHYSPKEFRDHSIKLSSIDRIWNFFNVLPNHSPRLDRANAISQRMDARCAPIYLPPRHEFQTTVDYYEAVAPLCIAQKRFYHYFQKDNCMRSIQSAARSVLPRLFH